MSAVGYIQGTGKNEQQRYRYTSDEDIMGKVQPALAANGIAVFPRADVIHRDSYSTKSGARMNYVDIAVDFTLTHSSGETSPPIRTVGSGADTGDKAVYKAMTGAYKYLYRLLLAIPTGDDAEKDSPEAAPRKAAAKPAPKATPPDTDRPPPAPANSEPSWQDVWPLGELAEYTIVKVVANEKAANVGMNYDGMKHAANYKKPQKLLDACGGDLIKLKGRKVKAMVKRIDHPDAGAVALIEHLEFSEQEG